MAVIISIERERRGGLASHLSPYSAVPDIVYAPARTPFSLALPLFSKSLIPTPGVRPGDLGRSSPSDPGSRPALSTTELDMRRSIPSISNKHWRIVKAAYRRRGTRFNDTLRAGSNKNEALLRFDVIDFSLLPVLPFKVNRRGMPRALYHSNSRRLQAVISWLLAIYKALIARNSGNTGVRLPETPTVQDVWAATEEAAKYDALV